MPNILVRNLEPATVEELRARAKRNERSVQAEVKAILEEATRSRAGAVERALRLSREMHEMTVGRSIPDSADMIRDDRESR
jgi:plasmid stability protein